MNPTTAVSAEAKECILMEAVAMVAIWFAWPFLWHLFGLFWMIAIVQLLMFGVTRYTTSVRRRIKAELTENALPIERYFYRVAKITYWIICIPHLIFALLINGPVVWIMTGLVVAIGGALLLHTWGEVKDLEAKAATPEAPPLQSPPA